MYVLLRDESYDRYATYKDVQSLCAAGGYHNYAIANFKKIPNLSEVLHKARGALVFN